MLKDVWDSAGLKIKGEEAIVIQLISRFSSYGISQAVGREAITGKQRPEVEVAPSDREIRESTEAATAEAMMKVGPKKRAGKKKSVKTKKSAQAEKLLPLLYDIARPDYEQPAAKLEFLVDQRTERKCRLPPVIGLLGVERRRRDREAKEEERRQREASESRKRFNTAGLDMK